MTPNICSVSNSEQLMTALRQADISVPPRTQGRTTHHTENWIICRLLSTLAEHKHLSFPVSLTHRDRPDFLIEAKDTKIGVEATEAITPEYAAFCALAEKEFPETFLEPAYFRWGAPKLTVGEMRALLREGRLTSDGWLGDRPELEWALFIQSAVDTKLSKLRQTGFAIFEQNWLSIYDNLPLPNVHLKNAVELLKPLIQDRWSYVPSFDTLLVEHGPVIVKICEISSDHLVLLDLWE